VHASLRRIGSGAATVADAISDVLGSTGTIVVLTATAENSDTSRAHLARTRHMSEPELRDYLAEMPAFNPATTPSTGMGALAEHIRTSRGARRSAHPQTSFAALGPLAAQLIEDHGLDCHLGEESPLAKMYKLDEARILMLGVGYDACTALHLAEYRYTPEPPTRHYRCVIERDGRRTWWDYEDVVLDDRDFGELGGALDETEHVASGRVGRAASRLIPLRQAVDFAAAWLAERRGL
jgi:aminoglycoside 3-N-acetyltransferase